MTAEAVVFTAKQIKDNIVASVKEFIMIFKTALLKFYRITSYRQSQQDMLDKIVIDQVLDTRVSWILFQTSKALFQEDYKHF